MSLERQAVKQAKRVVIKVGSRLIADDPPSMIGTLAREVATLRSLGVSALIVTSGAIALGYKRLGFASRPKLLPQLQASAASGQGRLMKLYDDALAEHGFVAAQVLLTHDDVRHRGRYLAARHTLLCLLGAGAVPVVNENDTVSTDEIKFGDNDRLAALCTSLVEADLLIILTDVAGLYDHDPRTEGARLLSVVRNIEEEATPVAGGAGSVLSTGGMASKVKAAQIACRFGVKTVVTSGRGTAPVSSVLAGDDVGTLFVPAQSRLQSRKHWIAYALSPRGSLQVDQGASRALRQGGKSLLPSGITAVQGDFEAGDPVTLCGPDQVEFARGLSGYSASEVRQIAGKQTSEIEAILGLGQRGIRGMDEVIHRDDLVLL